MKALLIFILFPLLIEAVRYNNEKLEYDNYFYNPVPFTPGVHTVSIDLTITGGSARLYFIPVDEFINFKQGKPFTRYTFVDKDPFTMLRQTTTVTFDKPFYHVMANDNLLLPITINGEVTVKDYVYPTIDYTIYYIIGICSFGLIVLIAGVTVICCYYRRHKVLVVDHRMHFEEV